MFVERLAQINIQTHYEQSTDVKKYAVDAIMIWLYITNNYRCQR